MNKNKGYIQSVLILSFLSISIVLMSISLRHSKKKIKDSKRYIEKTNEYISDNQNFYNKNNREALMAYTRIAMNTIENENLLNYLNTSNTLEPTTTTEVGDGKVLTTGIFDIDSAIINKVKNGQLIALKDNEGRVNEDSVRIFGINFYNLSEINYKNFRIEKLTIVRKGKDEFSLFLNDLLFLDFYYKDNIEVLKEYDNFKDKVKNKEV